MSTTASTSWVRLGQLPPTSLTDARLQLHHAAQVAVSAAISYIPARPDDSHTALSWSDEHRALVTEPLAAPDAVRIGLRVGDLTLVALDDRGRVRDQFALSGRTVADAHAWLAGVARDAGLDATKLTARKHYTIPHHAVASGAAFGTGPNEAFGELERYWSDAAHVLAEVARTTDGASAVRCWPHHFDIATLITLPTTSRPTIGVGQSPGDEYYAEPYWYVGPYPYPPASDLPPLPGAGHWHTAGWVGAALPASDYVGADTDTQRRTVRAFIDAAVAACRGFLIGR